MVTFENVCTVKYEMSMSIVSYLSKGDPLGLKGLKNYLP